MLSRWIERSDDGSIQIVALAGELDLHRCDDVIATCSGPAGHVLVDMGSVTFIDSGAYDALVDVRGRVERRGGTLFLANMTATVGRHVAMFDRLSNPWSAPLSPV